MTLTLVIVVGVALLVILAVGVGVSMDTEGQRREWRRVAEARRRLREAEHGVSNALLCERCPFRSDD